MTAHDERSRPPLPPPLGTLLSRVYGWEIARRNRRYDAGRGVVRFDRPVISVGNISVGGTGKTPMVANVARILLDAGHRPVIAMRGYASRRGRSDEAEEYRRRLPEVPVAARPDRTLALIEQFSREHELGGEPSDCIILDDGFQHRRIARDLDIVLIDASRNPFQDRLLPAGWLREPPQSLRRAHLVVITHAELASAGELERLNASVARVRGREAEVVARHTWRGLIVHDKGRDREETAAWLRGKRILAVCAIGNPRPFLAEAETQCGMPLASPVVLRDHDPFSRFTLERIGTAARVAGAEVILTTEKDWSKLGDASESGSGNRRRWTGPVPVARAKLQLELDRGRDLFRERVLEAAMAASDSHSAAEPAQPPTDTGMRSDYT
jgi:tetraacyldisaccharide 4'-kinase